MIEASKSNNVQEMAADERRAWTREGFVETSSPAASLRSAEDVVPHPDDIWIAVMGMTGVGKSTFISSLVGDDIGIGHGLNSTTQQLDVYPCRDLFERPMWIVDTPGFDDTSRSDVDILNEIATFFVKLYDKDIRFSGVIYLHRITDPKMSGTAIKNLELFKLICGERYFPLIRMVTTRWNELEAGSPEFREATNRENQLANSSKFFKPMLDGGSKLKRHEGLGQSAARAIVDSLLNPEHKMGLDIQYEMLTKRLRLSQTSAGRFLDREQSHLKRKYDDELKEIEASIKEAMRLRDENTLEMLRSERREATERRTRLEEDKRDLTATFRQLETRKMREIHAELVESGVPLRASSGDASERMPPQERPGQVSSGVRKADSRSIQTFVGPEALQRPPQSPTSSRRRQQSAFELGTLRSSRLAGSHARRKGSKWLTRLEDWFYYT